MAEQKHNIKQKQFLGGQHCGNKVTNAAYALRIVSTMSRKEGWLAGLWLIMGLSSLEGKRHAVQAVP